MIAFAAPAASLAKMVQMSLSLLKALVLQGLMTPLSKSDLELLPVGGVGSVFHLVLASRSFLPSLPCPS